MRRALACTLWAVVMVGGCGYPDFSFAPGPSHTTDGGPSAGGATTTVDGGVDSGIGGKGTGGTAQGGSGGATVRDASPDAPPPGCTVNADCAASPGGPFCRTDGRCVECGAGFPACAVGTRCTSEGLCEPGCDVDRDCVEVASLSDGGAREAGLEASVPDATTDARVPGTTPDARVPSRDAARDAHGSDGGGPHLICEASSHTCIGCATDSECPPGASCDAGRCVPVCNAARPCPTGFSCCGGACFSDCHSAEHCGGCAVSCGTDGGRGACVAGKCREDLCTEGRGDCDDNAANGCEADLFDDPANCGACSNGCSAQNASAVCHHGECALGECTLGFANCDGVVDATNACEVNLAQNTENCGTCGFACNLPNASQQCNKSVCELRNCFGGYADCDKLATTGCEVHTVGDPSNCGACGKVCSFPNAGATCVNGTCQLPKLGACIPPFQNCNLVASDGCEINTDSDPDNCGVCGTPCAVANGTAGCAGGACIVASCNNGFADCDGSPLNGCETNLNTSTKNCGACGTPCSTNHAAATCALGACSIQCASGFQDCDADATNGCEIQTATNVDNCGTCNKVCPTLGGTAHCVSGGCGISTCSGTLADCNGSPGDGCEVDTATNVGNCGGCGKACFTQNGTADCVAGNCIIKSCTTGFKDCNSDASDGCETRLNTVSQCGDCNTKCNLANANATCLTGICDIASCISPYADCDAKPANGCEVDTSSDVNNCGACSNAVSGGAACDATNGTPKCINGSCAITCNAGFANCNALVSDGCERSTRNDVNNCGACGAVCAVQNGKAACNGTTCVIQSCTAPFADCDHAYATGCETNTDTRIDACGACGHVCDTTKGTPTCTSGVCITPP